LCASQNRVGGGTRDEAHNRRAENRRGPGVDRTAKDDRRRENRPRSALPLPMRDRGQVGREPGLGPRSDLGAVGGRTGAGREWPGRVRSRAQRTIQFGKSRELGLPRDVGIARCLSDPFADRAVRRACRDADGARDHLERLRQNLARSADMATVEGWSKSHNW